MKIATMIKTMTLASSVLFAANSFAEQVKLVSQEPGGSWYSYGSTFGKLITDATNKEITVDVLPRGGGLTNPMVVDRKQADFGFTTSNAAVWARDGLGEAYKGRESKNIRAVIGDLQIGYTFVMARKDWVEKTGNDTLEKILDPASKARIGMKPTGSQVPLLADYIFQSLDTSLEALRKEGRITQVGGGQIAQMVRDNAIDVYIENSPAGQATVTEITLTTDMVFIPFPEKVLADMEQKGAPRGTMPANTFKGQDQDYVNPISPTIFITNKDVSDDVVYKVTKALVENEEKIKQNHAPFKSWDPEKGAQIEATMIELHPGAARYYREKGWIK